MKEELSRAKAEIEKAEAALRIAKKPLTEIEKQPLAEIKNALEEIQKLPIAEVQKVLAEVEKERSESIKKALGAIQFASKPAFDPTKVISSFIEEQGPSAMMELVEMGQLNLASEFRARIIARIQQFESGLDQAHEVGVRLVTFGQSITFHVADIGAQDPSLITFSGEMDDGSPVALVQHVSQISFLLMAVKRPDPNAPRRVFGFEMPAKQQPDPESNS